MAFTKRYYSKKGKIFVYGSGTLATLLAFLTLLNPYGVQITSTGDIQCAGTLEEPCISFVNLTNSGVLNLTFNGKLTVLYFDNETGVTYQVHKKDTKGAWRAFNITGKTLHSGEQWQLRITGFKPIDKTVKWGVQSGENNLDPVWSGYTVSEILPKLISNKASLGYGEAVFELNNPTSFNIVVDSKLMNFAFLNVSGQKIGEFERLINFSKPIIENKPVCTSVKQILANLTIYENATCSIVNRTLGYEEYFLVFDNFTLAKNTSRKVMLRGYWKPSLGFNSIDWVASLNISGTLYSRKEWAFWNTSFEFKRNDSLDTTGTSVTNVHYLINASGFDLGNPSGTNYAWGLAENADGSQFLYYNNNSNYALVNVSETVRLPLDMEEGNASDYFAYKVWNDTGWDMVFTMTDRGTNYNDVSTNGLSSNTILNADNNSQNGFVGEYVNFSDASYGTTNTHTVIVNDNAKFDSEAFTLCYWINLDRLGGNAEGFWMAKSADDAGGAEWMFGNGQVTGLNKNLTWRVFNGAAWQSIESSHTLVPKVWTHACGVETGTDGRILLYVNGTLIGNASMTGSRQKTAQNLHFNGRFASGNYQQTTPAAFDMVMWADRVVSGQEIKALYEGSARKVHGAAGTPFSILGVSEANLDTTAPNVTLRQPTNTTYSNSNISLQIDANEALNSGGCKYELDGTNSSVAACNTTFLTTQGPHSIKMYANDSANNTGMSNTIQFSVDLSGHSLTIQLDGANGNRTYEWGTTALINTTFNASGQRICLDIDVVGYGFNYTCGASTSYLEYNFTTFSSTQYFQGGGKEKNISLTANTVANISLILHRVAPLFGINLSLEGYPTSGILPENLTLRIGENSSIPYAFKGKLNGTNIQNFRLATGEFQKNFTFANSSSQTISLPFSIHTTSVSYANLTFFGPGGSIIMGNFNNSAIQTAIINVSTKVGNSTMPVSIPTQASVTSSSIVIAGGRYTLDGFPFRGCTRQVGSGGGAEACDENNDTKETTNSHTLLVNWSYGGYSAINVKSVAYRVRFAYDSGGSANYIIDLYNHSSRAYDIRLMTQTETDTSTRIVDSSVDYNGLSELINTSTGEIKAQMKVLSGTAPFGVYYLEIKPTLITSYPSNPKLRIGATGVWANTSTSWNANITLTNMTTALSNNLTGCGTDPCPVDLRLESGGNATFTLTLMNITYAVNVQNLTLDIGADGVNDHNYTGILNDTTGTINISLSVSRLKEVAINCTVAAGNGICNVPISMRSRTGGTVELRRIAYEYATNPIVLNRTAILFYRDTRSGYVTIPLNFTSNTTSVLEVSNLTEIYNGSAVYNITARVDSPLKVNTSFLKVVFSSFNRSLPYNFTNSTIFIPLSNSTKNVTPFGQTNLTPIYNITGTGYELPFNFIFSLNETLSSCFALSGSNTSTGASILAGTSRQLIYYGASSGTNFGLWLSLNLSNCASPTTAAFIGRTIRVNTTCGECVVK